MLIIHAWFFLPNHDATDVGFLHLDNFHLSSSASNSNGRSFKKRIRTPHDGSSSSTVATATATLLRRAVHESKSDYIRYDAIPNVLENTQSIYGVVHQLPSIPNRRRMMQSSGNNFTVPLNAVHNLTYFLESRERKDEEDRPLYIYNPMLLPLDNNLIDNTIINDLTFGTRQHDAAYVGVFRVSNFGNCHGPGRGVPETYQNYLGLALLDIDLNIVQDPVSGDFMDVVIDLNQHLHDVKWSPSGRKKMPAKPNQSMQDCQIFATHPKDSTKSNQLILLCNEFAMPILLQKKGSPKRTNTIDKEDERIVFRNSYGSGLQLTSLRLPNTIMAGGKNMHYFRSGHDQQGPAFLEIWPGGPHESMHVDFETYPFVSPHVKNALMKPSYPEPHATWNTLDEIHDKNDRSSLIDRDSGSACCVRIRWKDEDTPTDDDNERELLLGFSHRKTRRVPKAGQYNYVSRLYAFDPM